MSVLNFFRKIIYYGCTETPAELAERQKKALQEILDTPYSRYQQRLIKCPKCGSSKIFPPMLDKFICGDCANTFVDDETQHAIDKIYYKLYHPHATAEETRRRVQELHNLEHGSGK